MVKYDPTSFAIAELSVASECLLIIASLLDFASYAQIDSVIEVCTFMNAVRDLLVVKVTR